jgi:succinate dehydrogenase / fumarate reductase membrane anchor subunit
MVSARDTGAAHRGLGHFLVQRATAVVIALAVIYAAIRWLACPPAGYAAWRDWIGAMPMRIGMMLVIVALLAHAWIGLRSVYLDYLTTLRVRVLVSALTATGLIAMLAWSGEILLWGFGP